jgi:hypothetical protein
MYKKILFFLSCISLQLSHASSFSFELPGIKTVCAGIGIGIAGSLAYKYCFKKQPVNTLDKEDYMECCSDLETHPTDKLVKKSCRILSKKLFHFYTKKRKRDGHFTMTYFGIHKGTTAILLEHYENRYNINGKYKWERLKIVIPSPDEEYRNALMKLLIYAKENLNKEELDKKSFNSLLSERNLNKCLLLTESTRLICQGLPANIDFKAA